MTPGFVNKQLVSLANWLMPPTCVVCGGNGDNRDLCHDCAMRLPWNLSCCARCALPLAIATKLCGGCAGNPPVWSRAVSPFIYDFPVDNLLRQLKFSRRLAHGNVLGQLLAEWVVNTGPQRPDLLIPVPLHWRRLLRRQFNQAEEIARPVSNRLNIAIAGDLCRRRRRTPKQSGMTAQKRKRNLRDAFVVRGNVDGANLAVIDDVMTTGSTLTELSNTLLQAGARRVEVWTVARVAAPG